MRSGKNGAPAVTDGPFAEAKEMVGGFWIMRADSLEDATAIAARAPIPSGRIEIRQSFASLQLDLASIDSCAFMQASR